MKIAFVDTETTGLNFGLGGDGSDSDQILEVCVKVWNDGAIERAFVQKYFAQGPLSEGAQRVNKYDAAAWQAGGAIYWNANAAGVVAGLIAEADMLGGAATAFDRDVLKSSFRKVRAAYPEKTHRLLDVQSMAAPLILAGKISSPSLAKICEHFGIVNQAEHTAEGDVDATIQVFEKLAELYWPVLAAA
jgi:DNA polymerase III alpha subunit (gram-positive type)